LARIAERPQFEGSIGSPACDPDAPAVAGQRLDDMPSDKAGSAKYCRQSVLRLINSHQKPRNSKGSRRCMREEAPLDAVAPLS
jgi:hypothetical protein